MHGRRHLPPARCGREEEESCCADRDQASPRFWRLHHHHYYGPHLTHIQPFPPAPFSIKDDTIITWTDVDVGTDVALSFQEATGCHAIWCAACRLLRTRAPLLAACCLLLPAQKTAPPLCSATLCAPVCSHTFPAYPSSSRHHHYTTTGSTSCGCRTRRAAPACGGAWSTSSSRARSRWTVRGC